MWLDDWWERTRDDDKQVREKAKQDLSEAYPVKYGTATGESTMHPWSAVLGCRTRLQKVIDLTKTRASLFDALGNFNKGTNGEA